MTLFIIGLVLFLGIHLLRVMAPGLRANMIDTIGKGGFHALFSVLSVATLCLLIYGFGQARLETGILYEPPMFLRHLTMLLMLIAVIVLVSGFLPAGYIATYTKHPMVLSVKIWALAHLLVNGETVQVILFVAFLAWAVVLRIAYKRRQRAGDLIPKTYKSWKFDVASVLIGAAVYGAIVAKLHMLLIGVPVM